jgi:hypothetical protein
MKLKTAEQINEFKALVGKCVGNVYLVSPDRNDFFNMRSNFSKFIAIDRLLNDPDTSWEVHCSDPFDQLKVQEFINSLEK